MAACRPIIAGTICATSNAASIYIEALRKPAQYLTDKGTPLKDDIAKAVRACRPKKRSNGPII